MDISKQISELLYNYDCVIVPGFGGFISNYRPAEVHPVVYSISPPAKAISFNKNLTGNDGLLANYIAEKKNISYETSLALINGWVTASLALLNNRDTLIISGIGELFINVEGSLQFIPYADVNYLKTSFGLKTIHAHPVTHQKEFTLPKIAEEKKPLKKRTFKERSRPWSRIAALVLLLLTIAGTSLLMINGIGITALQLNEANMLSFITHMSSVEQKEILPLPIPIAAGKATLPIAQPPTTTENIVPKTESNHYIIIGAFRNPNNINTARKQILASYPNAYILEEQIGSLTRIGYRADSDLQKAYEQLNAAREKDSTCWLYKKN
jgi:cell division septation protein DedD